MHKPSGGFLTFVRALPAHFRWRVLLAGLVYVGAAIGVEGLAGLCVTAEGTTRELTFSKPCWPIAVVVEESGEIVAMTIFILSVIAILAARTKAVTLKLPRSGSSPSTNLELRAAVFAPRCLCIICRFNSFEEDMIAIRKSPTLLLLMLGLFVVAPRLTQAEATLAQDVRLKEIIAGDHRSAENKARDQYRNPLETLTFFGIRPDMTVVEIYPGRGWYTEVLAPYLKGSGTLYAAEHPGDPSYAAVQESLKAFDQKVKAAPELYGEVKRTKLTKDGDIAPPGSADLVVTFRNVHSWIGSGTANESFAAMFRALKPGGVLGLVQHRGDPNVKHDPKAGSGYVTEDYVIELAKKAGFELAEKSEINANPKDTKDYAKGVWTLPPSLRLGDEDRDKYLAIGESDRMTLKFVKPMS